MYNRVKILLIVIAVLVFACNPNLTDDDILPNDNNNSTTYGSNPTYTGQGSTQSGNGAATNTSCNLIA